MAPRVFLSCALVDLKVGRTVERQLEEAGISCFLGGGASLAVGARWRQVLEAEIRQASTYVIVISREAAESEPMRYELSEILKQAWADEGKRIVLLVDDRDAVPATFARCPSLLWESARDDLTHRLLDAAPREATVFRRDPEAEARLDQRLAQVDNAAVQQGEREPDE